MVERLLHFAMAAVEMLIDEEVDEEGKGGSKGGKKGGGGKKGEEKASRRISFGVSTSTLSAVRQVLPPVALLLSHLCEGRSSEEDYSSVSSSLTVAAPALLRTLISKAHAVNGTNFESFHPSSSASSAAAAAAGGGDGAKLARYL